MKNLKLLAKRNQDGSFSVSIQAKDLIDASFVDFYDESTGAGYQRREPSRNSRGRAISRYIQRCKSEDIIPSLFEMAGNIRKGIAVAKFDPLDDDGFLGFLDIEFEDKAISLIDGGTRTLGIEVALSSGLLQPTDTFDIRLFSELSMAEEIAQFLLINDTQKKVRTDLSLRVVQRNLDDDELTDREKLILKTVVPPSETWKFDASRLTAIMNTHDNSPWKGLIQMPSDNFTKPVKMQAFFTSVKPLLTNPDLKIHYEKLVEEGIVKSDTEFLASVLNNFWNAIKQVNPDAHLEPTTNVLWGSIGASGCHAALAPILLSILDSAHPDLTQERFVEMLKNSPINDYEFWFTKAGTKKDAYPDKKGDGPTMTGFANYTKLGKDLEKEWRSALHSDRKPPKIIL